VGPGQRTFGHGPADYGPLSRYFDRALANAAARDRGSDEVAPPQKRQNGQSKKDISRVLGVNAMIVGHQRRISPVLTHDDDIEAQ